MDRAAAVVELSARSAGIRRVYRDCEYNTTTPTDSTNGSHHIAAYAYLLRPSEMNN